MNLGEGAVLKGAVNPDNQAEKMTVNLAKDAKWELTGDAYVTSLTDEDVYFSNIESHGHNIYCDDSEGSFGGKTIKLPGGGKLMAH